MSVCVKAEVKNSRRVRVWANVVTRGSVARGRELQRLGPAFFVSFFCVRVCVICSREG